MAGVQVGKRIIGADAPVTVGWENIGKVEGGPIKRFVFTWFVSVRPATSCAVGAGR